MSSWLQPVVMTGAHARLVPLERTHVPALADAVRDGETNVVKLFRNLQGQETGTQALKDETELTQRDAAGALVQAAMEEVELLEELAPKTAENFATLAKRGYYDGIIFHRVVPGFVIQGGGLTPDFAQKKTRAPVKNEAANGLKNLRGTLSMARTDAPHSATSQFFVNLKDNDFLDHAPVLPGSPSGEMEFAPPHCWLFEL